MKAIFSEAIPGSHAPPRHVFFSLATYNASG
jgi:hypothetical protein